MCSRSVLDTVINTVADESSKLLRDSLKKVILYGSYARGDNDDESDIDVMIMVDMPQEELAGYRRQVSHMCSDINIENSVFVSPILQSLQTFNAYKDVLPFFKNVTNEGVSYYG